MPRPVYCVAAWMATDKLHRTQYCVTPRYSSLYIRHFAQASDVAVKNCDVEEVYRIVSVSYVIFAWLIVHFCVC